MISIRDEIEQILDDRDEAERRTGHRSRRATDSTVWERILTKYGLATLLALAFFWWITSDVSGNIRAIKMTLDDHIFENTFYLRALCLNAARDDTQRATCVPPGKR